MYLSLSIDKHSNVVAFTVEKKSLIAEMAAAHWTKNQSKRFRVILLLKDEQYLKTHILLLHVRGEITTNVAMEKAITYKRLILKTHVIQANHHTYFFHLKLYIRKYLHIISGVWASHVFVSAINVDWCKSDYTGNGSVHSGILFS